MACVWRRSWSRMRCNFADATWRSKALAEEIRMDWRAIGFGEDEATILVAVADEFVLGSLARTVLDEHAYGSPVEIDEALAAVSLGVAFMEFVGDRHERSADRESPSS